MSAGYVPLVNVVLSTASVKLAVDKTTLTLQKQNGVKNPAVLGS